MARHPTHAHRAGGSLDSLMKMDSSLSPYLEALQNMIKQGFSDKQISNHLHFECGLTRGFSITNIRRFCTENGIGRERVQDSELEVRVVQAINEIGRPPRQCNTQIV